MVRVIRTVAVIVGCWVCSAMAGCAAIPVQRATAVDLSGGTASDSRAGVEQRAVGIGNVSNETAVPMGGISAFWPQDSLSKTLLAAAFGVVVVAVAIRKFVGGGSKKGAVPPEGGAS